MGADIPEKIIAPWIKTLTYVIERVGLHTLVVVGILGIFIGIVPNPWTDEHKAMINILKQNQVMILGDLYTENARCMNEAERDQNGQTKVRVSRCKSAMNKTLGTLQSLGMFPRYGSLETKE